MTSPHRERLEPDKLSALWRACNSTDTAPLVELIEALDPPVDDLKPGFWYAIKDGNLIMMRYLLDQGISFGGHEVQEALRAQSIPALEMLREYGWEDVNMNLGEGGSARTALGFATGDPTLVSYLLARGANPNLGPGASGNIGTPQSLHLISNSGSTLRAAVRWGSLESLDLLLAHGAEPANAKLMHAATAGGRVSAMARVLELGGDINERDDMLKTGYPTYGTPLLRAIKTGETEAVRFLLERGASVTKLGYDGLTPLKVVRMECCGGRSPCLVHGSEIVPEIRELVETAVERERSENVNKTRERARM